jgi:hypothetical protein
MPSSASVKVAVRGFSYYRNKEKIAKGKTNAMCLPAWIICKTICFSFAVVAVAVAVVASVSAEPFHCRGPWPHCLGGGDQTNWPGDYPENWRATIPRTGGRLSQELAGDQPKEWRATNPRNGGRPTQGMAGDQPKKWWATNPRNGGRPTPGIASRSMVFPNGPDSQAASQPDRNQAT